MIRSETFDTSQHLASLIEQSLSENKASDIQVIDLTGKSDVADFMIIASGTSSRHVSALAKHVREDTFAAGFRLSEPDGTGQCDWVLIDSPHVVVHLFKPEAREYYDIERLWVPDIPAAEMAEAVY